MALTRISGIGAATNLQLYAALADKDTSEGITPASVFQSDASGNSGDFYVSVDDGGYFKIPIPSTNYILIVAKGYEPLLYNIDTNDPMIRGGFPIGIELTKASEKKSNFIWWLLGGGFALYLISR